MELLTFNANAGYHEGLVRGLKAGILHQTDYINLTQCENLDGKAASSLAQSNGRQCLHAPFLMILCVRYKRTKLTACRPEAPPCHDSIRKFPPERAVAACRQHD